MNESSQAEYQFPLVFQRDIPVMYGHLWVTTIVSQSH